jgi:hypothetical protein
MSRGPETTVDWYLTTLAREHVGKALELESKFDYFLAGKTRSEMEYVVAIKCKTTKTKTTPAPAPGLDVYHALEMPRGVEKKMCVYIVYWDQEATKDGVLGSDAFGWFGGKPRIPFMIIETHPCDYGPLRKTTSVEVCFPEEVAQLGRLDVIDLARNIFCGVRPWLALYDEICAEVCMDYPLHEWLQEMWKDLGLVQKTNMPMRQTYWAESHRIVCDADSMPFKVNLRKKFRMYNATCMPRLGTNLKVVADVFSDSPVFRLWSLLKG